MKLDQKGFTLIEIAVVLIIVGILLGYTMALFPIQQELKQYREANDQMDEIIDALIGFAQVNGRLPCPDTGVGVYDGIEDTLDLIVNATGVATSGVDILPDTCSAFFGYIPSATLGMNGDTNSDGVLQDPWGGGYRYAVSDISVSGFGLGLPTDERDLVSPNGIREEGLSAFSPVPAGLLFICDNSSTASGPDDEDCTDVTGDLVTGNVAAVIISLGKSSDLITTSHIQRENFDDFDDGTDDKVYISASRSDASATEYDDIVKWISINQLFSKMIEADQLP